MTTPDTPDTPFLLGQMAGQPRRRGGLIAGIAGGAVVLVAATVAVTIAATRAPDARPAAQQQAPAPTTAAATPPAATVSIAAATTATEAGTMKLGQKVDGPKMTVVAYAYKQPVAAKAPKPDQDGFEWAAADVEVCAKEAGFLNNSVWVLIYADHTRFEPSSVGYRQFPEPEYPWADTDVTAGQCVRGWITFAVPAGQRPVTVHYQPDGFQADWQVT